MTHPFSSGRPTKAYIDTQAFVHNIERAEDLVPGCAPMVVIKADAYGHGLLELAGCVGERALAVATPDEARALLEADVSNDVWVLEGPFSEGCLDLSEMGNIVWVVHSEWQLDLLASCSKSLNICLKLNTGMNRLGFSSEQLVDVLSFVEKRSSVRLVACMTHFASSDLPDNPSVKRQLAQFKSFRESYGLGAMDFSIANSGGVLYYADDVKDGLGVGDRIRPGIMLYGAMPNAQSSAREFELKPVMSFESAVMAIHKVAKGERVGYGGTWQAEQDSLIAHVAVGYGDGYPRHAPTGTPVFVKGNRAPLAGRVSMDMLAVDVTNVNGVKVGDPVELWGGNISVDEVALAAGTIAYELLTGVTKRVPRVYRTASGI